ncbi:zinc transporter, ZIP family [Austwickia chelonae]|uniref:Zinc transporter ZupT n=1 Tax=Austwickia chelonae NBRC 105200 TaxID=1184607 RepID=K6VPZ0_9MICO|nr:zinc transporter ZupT [Austwickia chelonae]GAB77440.1 zinc transporter ZupT [Austwickia chelonae NBRC 105200]SEW10480.1 zinc transporter, ZIP family [Austwickia chelonae]
MSPVGYALTLSLFAGLSTGIGSLLGVAARQTSPKLLASSLGLSAGVMLYISLVELVPGAQESLRTALGEHGGWVAVTAFFCGVALIGVIDALVPSEVNPHETHTDPESVHQAQLMRMGLLTAAALAIHNFPEGFATFMTAISSPDLGLPVAVAVAVHNVPEGIAVAVPVYFATGSRAKAFGYSFASGLAEPAGALLAYLVLAPYLTPAVTGVVLAGVAGIMVYICLDELLPSAHAYGEHHVALAGVMSGMFVMAVSLQLLG